MTVQQKQAWFTLVVCVAALVAYAVLLPLLGPDRAWGALGSSDSLAFRASFLVGEAARS